MKWLLSILTLTVLQMSLAFQITQGMVDALSMKKEAKLAEYLNTPKTTESENKVIAAPVLILYSNQATCEWRTTNYFEQTLNTYAVCMEVATNETWLINSLYEVKPHGEKLCERVHADENLKNGNFSIVAFSHGGMLARYLIEYCSFPQPIRHIVTFGSPLNGVSAVSNFPRSGYFGSIIDYVIDKLIDYGWMDNIIMSADYWRNPKDHEDYLANSRFLAEANNEVSYSEQRKRNWLSLTRALFIKWDDDTHIIPKESAWWAEYDEDMNVIERHETEIYKNDLIGLKTLEERGQTAFVALPGDHMAFNYTQINDHVLPVLRQ
jgi:palmitoyl-protein thioesterase